MSKKTCNTYSESLQRYVDEYLEETGKSEYTSKEVAVWAIRTGRWEPPIDLVIKKCQEDFSRAMRDHHTTNEFGQPVRLKHVARIYRGGQQLHLWGDIRTMPRKHIEISFQQRREQIVGDCRQLKRDIDFFNEQNIGAEKFQTVFDFREDIEEGEYSAEYAPVNTSDQDHTSLQDEAFERKKIAR